MNMDSSSSSKYMDTRAAAEDWGPREVEMDRRTSSTSANLTDEKQGDRHGTGSLGHRVNRSFGSSFTSGSPGHHHFDTV